MMKRFLIKILLTGAIVFAMFCYPMYRYYIGACYGDAYTLGAKTFAPEYRWIFDYDPHFERLAVSTDNYPEVACDSSVLVVGDSFSQLGRASFMQYLQNELKGWTVFNVQQGEKDDSWYYIHRSLNPSDTTLYVFDRMTDYIVYMLENSPKLPDVIVMESIENNFVSRTSDVKFHIASEDLKPYLASSGIKLANPSCLSPYATRPRGSFIYETGRALNAAQSWIKKHLGIGNRTKSAKLTKKMFSCPGDDQVLYQWRQNGDFNSVDELNRTIDNQQRLIRMAEEHGVKLIFFIAPDKMRLYRKYIADINPSDDNPCIRDYMSSYSKDIHYQLNYAALQKEIDRGVMDIYPTNDFHWSYKAASVTGKELAVRCREIVNREQSDIRRGDDRYHLYKHKEQ